MRNRMNAPCFALLCISDCHGLLRVFFQLQFLGGYSPSRDSLLVPDDSGMINPRFGRQAPTADQLRKPDLLETHMNIKMDDKNFSCELLI